MISPLTAKLQQPRILSAEPEAGNYFVAAYPPFSAWSAQYLPEFEDALEQPQSGALGLYIHLPFCQHKCDYCYYLSYIGQSAKVVDRYLDSLVGEMEVLSRQAGVRCRPVSFVYFGGGTPSTLSSKQLRRLVGGLKHELGWDAVKEVTYECAPRSVSDDFLSTLRDVGVTRLSMGVQSFDDDLLKLNGRIHLGDDVARAFERIRRAGFDWVNLDLMCGLLGETEEKWRETVRRVIDLAPESVTIYQTEIPHNTKLYRDLKAGTLPADSVSWETKRARLDYGFQELEAAGYTIASAYNAVKDPGRHRFLYQDHLWRGDDMLGLGVASFGYIGGVHYQNETSLETYEAAVDFGNIPAKRAFPLSLSDRVVREFVLQLKLGVVSTTPSLLRYGIDLFHMFEESLNALEAEGFLIRGGGEIHLTRKGLLRVDRLLPMFYAPQYQQSRYT